MSHPESDTQAPRRARFITRADALAWIILAIAALIAALPLLTHGYSCGHDFDFHLRSWMETSTQWKGGILKPIWAFHAAWNAGEPRLLFYPPLSIVTGSLLTLILPWSGIAYGFTAFVLFLSGVTMHRLLRRWVSPGLAIFGGCLYLVNPYMLFCAYERTAYAELMAAAWMPLLLLAILSRKTTAWRVAIAIALLWITNAPAAVVGCYSLLLIGAARWIYLLRKHPSEAKPYFLRLSGGFFLGLLLDSFYLVPFAIERKYITLNAALTPAANPDANYLFEYTADEFHNGVLLHTSTIVLILVFAALLCGAIFLLQERKRVQPFPSMHARDAALLHHDARHVTIVALILYSAVVLFLQTPFSSPIWHHGPELAFLQFPWRFLAMQSAVSVAVVMLTLKQITASRKSLHNAKVVWIAASIVLVIAAAYGLANRTFRQGCDDEEGLTPQWNAFHHNEGFEQTDEYTPAG
ncbi:MAG TPA: 6-pyruvoyl-tetrahydropterin synthase-related protein, partial [Terriglobus sp.]